MKISERALNLSPSEPRRIYDAAQKYTNVIDLTLGDPDLPPPENIQSAACQAICAGKTRYSANAGLPVCWNCGKLLPMTPLNIIRCSSILPLK